MTLFALSSIELHHFFPQKMAFSRLSLNLPQFLFICESFLTDLTYISPSNVAIEYLVADVTHVYRRLLLYSCNCFFTQVWVSCMWRAQEEF